MLSPRIDVGCGCTVVFGLGLLYVVGATGNDFPLTLPPLSWSEAENRHQDARVSAHPISLVERVGESRCQYLLKVTYSINARPTSRSGPLEELHH